MAQGGGPSRTRRRGPGAPGASGAWAEAGRAWREAPELVLSVAVLAAALPGAAVLAGMDVETPPDLGWRGGSMDVLFVDALSAMAPNATLVAEVTRLIETAGHRVEYHPAENATVDFFRGLPARGHDLVVLRVHSTAWRSTARGLEAAPTAVFTSEPAGQGHLLDQVTGRLKVGRVSWSPEQAYFALTPAFVSRSMEGRFANSVILMMGCEGLANPALARAFIEEGARAYVGWDLEVTAERTDSATLRLIEGLLYGNATLSETVSQVMHRMGPDLQYGSHLRMYPDGWAHPTRRTA